MKQTLSQKIAHSIANRNDDYLERKWSGKTEPYVDGIDCSNDPGCTDPSGAQDADINNIVATFHKTGVLPNINVQGVYADVSNPMSYQDALQTVINAEKQFMALDAKTRKKFSNNPAEFLEFVDDPQNAAELVSMGLGTIVDKTPSPAAPVSTGGQPEALNQASKPVSTPNGVES